MHENILHVNEKKEYHNCALRFSMYSSDATSDFKVDDTQLYCINTTLKEVELLNEALHIHQSDDFKRQYLTYFEAHDAESKYPEFTPRFEASQKVAKALKALAQDEDALTQLQSYVLDIVPTYRDDYFIDKKLELLSIDGENRILDGYEDTKVYIETLKIRKSALFV